MASSAYPCSSSRGTRSDDREVASMIGSKLLQIFDGLSGPVEQGEERSDRPEHTRGHRTRRLDEQARQPDNSGGPAPEKQPEHNRRKGQRHDEPEPPGLGLQE